MILCLNVCERKLFFLDIFGSLDPGILSNLEKHISEIEADLKKFLLVMGNHYVALSFAKKVPSSCGNWHKAVIWTASGLVWQEGETKAFCIRKIKTKDILYFSPARAARIFLLSCQILISRFGIHFARWLLNNLQALIIMRNKKRGKSLHCRKKQVMRKIKALR